MADEEGEQGGTDPRGVALLAPEEAGQRGRGGAPAASPVQRRAGGVVVSWVGAGCERRVEERHRGVAAPGVRSLIVANLRGGLVPRRRRAEDPGPQDGEAEDRGERVGHGDRHQLGQER